ncbi:28S ribosomal protein S5, mitochondrial [Coemansia sp. RSA 552]|nr:28S ribosomal protein S5, mitochondrial [Coemansia sp. RSA 552]
MSGVVARIGRAVPRVLGTRALTASAPVAKPRIDKSRYVPVDSGMQMDDLTRLHPVYDNVQDNQSIIELWRRQKAAELRATNPERLDELDQIIQEEHGIERQMDAADYVDYSLMPVEKINRLEREKEKVEAAKRKKWQEMWKNIRTAGESKVAPIQGGNSIVLWKDSMNFPYEEFRRLTKKVLVTKSVVQMTSKGKVRTIYVLVIVGNGRGSAGYGEAKSMEMAKAVMVATRRAIQSMRKFPRYDNRTLYHDIEHKFCATKLVLWARRPGFGCRISPVIHEVCQCVGIQDIAGKIHGSRNPMNVIKGVFEALASQRVPTDLAKARGLRLIDVNHKYYGGIKPSPVAR